MSLHDYEQSKEIAAGRAVIGEPTFAALVMATARRADSVNFARLRNLFPDTINELQNRYDAPGGLLPGES